MTHLLVFGSLKGSPDTSKIRQKYYAVFGRAVCDNIKVFLLVLAVFSESNGTLSKGFGGLKELQLYVTSTFVFSETSYG